MPDDEEEYRPMIVTRCKCGFIKCVTPCRRCEGHICA